MALQLQKEYKGIQINYCKILGSRSYYTLDKIIIVLGWYKDQSTRDADINNFIINEEIKIEGVCTEIGEDKVRAQIYSHLKTLPEFEGAVDC